MKRLIIGGFLFLLAVCSSPGQSDSPRAAFEVASVKANHSGDRRIMIRPTPGGRFVAENIPVRILLQTAYRIQPFQLTGGPNWIDSDHYDIDARAAGNVPNDQLPAMLQSLLEDRFQLKFHRETKDMPVYALMVSKNGPKLQESKEGNCATPDPSRPPAPPEPGKLPPTPCGGFFMGPNQMNAGKVRIAAFTQTLSGRLGRPVIDKTGLTGTYDIHLEWAPDSTLPAFGPGGPPPPSDTPADTSGPSIFTAIQEQLGLRLEAQKGPVEIIVIDHIEKASEN